MKVLQSGLELVMQRRRKGLCKNDAKDGTCRRG